MRLGVYRPQGRQGSVGIHVYRDNITRELAVRGVEISYFSEADPLPPDADLFWDPRVAAASKPCPALLSASHRYAVTLHGVLSFTVPAHERYDNWPAMAWDRVKNMSKRRVWHHVRHDSMPVITPTQFVRDEAIKHLGLTPAQVMAIWEGVDHAMFAPGTQPPDEPLYLLHISNGLPTKNVQRLIAAYERLPQATRPPLKLRMPRLEGPLPDGIEWVDSLDLAALVALYQGAMSFVLPSLHEGFGLPIVEAMACGCPVITSNVTACAEVAGDAALLVDPRSVDDLAAAMQRMVEDAALRAELHQRGLQRAKMFTWQRSAEAHLKVFEKVLNEH